MLKCVSEYHIPQFSAHKLEHMLDVYRMSIEEKSLAHMLKCDQRSMKSLTHMLKCVLNVNKLKHMLRCVSHVKEVTHMLKCVSNINEIAHTNVEMWIIHVFHSRTHVETCTIHSHP